MRGDALVERGAAGLRTLSREAAARGGVAARLAEPLAEDADFLPKLKPSLIAARLRGDRRTEPPPGRPEPARRIRRELALERAQLTEALGDLRRSLGVPLLAAGAFAAGFVLAGGIGAAFRLVFRPRRESRTTLRVGRFAVVDGRR